MVDRVFDDYCMSGDKRVPCCVMYVPPAFIAYVIIWFISSIWTIFTLLGVDSDKVYHTPLGRPVPIVNGGKRIDDLLA